MQQQCQSAQSEQGERGRFGNCVESRQGRAGSCDVGQADGGRCGRNRGRRQHGELDRGGIFDSGDVEPGAADVKDAVFSVTMPWAKAFCVVMERLKPKTKTARHSEKLKVLLSGFGRKQDGFVLMICDGFFVMFCVDGGKVIKILTSFQNLSVSL